MVSPMCQYSAQDGHVTDWHLVHLGKFAQARALSGSAHGEHDMSDIAFTPKAKQDIEAVRPGLAAEFEKAGFTFNAGR